MSLPKLQTGKLIALPRVVEVRADAGAGDLSSADLSNVVRFARGRVARQAPEVAPPADAVLAATVNLAPDRIRVLAFAALSLMAHAGLLWAFWREPAPLASIGEQVISLEIVVGGTAPAGVAQAPGEQEVQAAAAHEPQQNEPEPEQQATPQPQTIQVGPEEKAPEQAAKAETPVEPEVTTEAPKREQEMPRQVAPDTELAIVPPPEEKPPAPKAQPPKPVQHAAPAKEHRRIEAPTRAHAAKNAKASAPSSAANNLGVGRSDADSNYAGLVSAHLRRHQQYPADARSRGEQGTATVSFSLDGGGRVISERLVRGSGIASLDQEVQAMVRRSSPFPAPPSGHGVSFTVPVSFRVH
jgi:protein TonB